MLERYNIGLKIVCAALTLLIIFQVSQLFARKDPLANVGIDIARTPAIPSESNAPASRTGSPSPLNGVRGETVRLTSAEIQTRIDRIVQSEILGVVSGP